MTLCLIIDDLTRLTKGMKGSYTAAKVSELTHERNNIILFILQLSVPPLHSLIYHNTSFRKIETRRKKLFFLYCGIATVINTKVESVPSAPLTLINVQVKQITDAN